MRVPRLRSLLSLASALSVPIGALLIGSSVTACASEAASEDVARSEAPLMAGPDCPGELGRCYDACGMGPASCYTSCDTTFRRCIGLEEPAAALAY